MSRKVASVVVVVAICLSLSAQAKAADGPGKSGGTTVTTVAFGFEQR